MTTFVPDDRATCTRVDPDLFFPQRDNGTTTATARRLCAVCPLTEACRDYAMKHSVMGIWGGTTERERKAERARLGMQPIPLRIGDELRLSQTPDAIAKRRQREREREKAA
jgi:hypothetical protein